MAVTCVFEKGVMKRTRLLIPTGLLLLVCNTVVGSLMTPQLVDLYTNYGLCNFWSGSTYFNGSCFMVMTISKTWFNAENSCPHGGFLAETPDEQTFHFIRNMLISRWSGSSVIALPTFLGARRASNSANFAWESNSDEVLAIPGHTSPSWPHHGASNQDCVAIGLGANIVGYSCGAQGHYVCQRTVDPICEPGYRYYDGHCYIYVDEPKKYNEAKRFCNRQHSDLVEIHTKHVADFLKEFLTENMVKTVSRPLAMSTAKSITNFGVQKDPLEDFCFGIKGEVIAEMFLTNSTCGSIYFRSERVSNLVTSAIKVCDCNGTCDTDEIVQSLAVGQLSIFCIQQDMVQMTIKLMTVTSSNSLVSVPVVNNGSLQTYSTVKIKVATNVDHQWLFLKNQFVYIGAKTGSLSHWEHGGIIDYAMLRGHKLYKPTTTARTDNLLLGIFQYQFKSSYGRNEYPFICQKRLGRHFYFGVLPPELYDTSVMSLSFHHSNTIAFFNCAPNIATWSKTKALPISKANGEVVLFRDVRRECSDGGFVLRCKDPITVVLFWKWLTNHDTFGTLMFSHQIGGEEYVICAEETQYGMIFIMNHWHTNNIIVQVPELRKLYIIESEKHYRIRHAKISLNAYASTSLTFTGDISGTIISGKVMSVFVGIAKVGRQNFDTVLPADILENEYFFLDGIHTENLTLAFEYKVVAIYSETYIEDPKGDFNISIEEAGETKIWPYNARGDDAQGLTAKHRFYVTLVIRAGQSRSCQLSLIPLRHWSRVYTIKTMSVSATPATLLAVVGSSSAPDFIVNDQNQKGICSKIVGSHYHGCMLELDASIYSKVSLGDSSKFAAYFVSCSVHSCLCTMAGILPLGPNKQNYRASPLEEPEECPELPVASTSYPYFNVSLTENVKQEIREKVKKELAVDTKTTSNFIRSKISAKDDRPSSTSLGVLGIVMFSLVLVVVIGPDLATFIYWAYNKFGKTSKAPVKDPGNGFVFVYK